MRLIEAAPELLVLAKDAVDHLQIEFLKLAEKYAGTPYENDTAYLVARKKALDGISLIDKVEGH
jgi:hypothetical protein